MVSDDTEHTIMVFQSLVEAEGDVDRFRRAFARRLRFWLLLVPAGAGLATVKSVLRLWVGIPPTRSGVQSAGNGAAMRSAVIGAFYRDDPARRVAFVEAASQVTHRDRRAIEGAQLVALAAASSCVAEFDRESPRYRTDPAWEQPFQPADRVSGYVIPSVQAALLCWRSHPNDFRAAVTMAVEMGGDTDTVAAIVGGIVGSQVGEDGIPMDWLAGLVDWPRGVEWMRRLGPYTWPFLPIRNAVFLVTVLAHGLRRLLPPY